MRKTGGWACLALAAVFFLSGVRQPNALIGSLLISLSLLVAGVRLLGSKAGMPREPKVSSQHIPLVPPSRPGSEHIAADSPVVPTPIVTAAAAPPGTHSPSQPRGRPVAPWARARHHQRIVGEQHLPAATFREILKRNGRRLGPAGTELPDIEVQLVADPNNPFDSDAVGAWITGMHVGYLPREVAVCYAPALNDLAEQGLVLTVPGRLWLSSEEYGERAAVTVLLPPDNGVQSFNEFPDEPYQVLPEGKAIQVNGEDRYMDALAPFTSDRGRYVAVTLHLAVEELKTTTREVIEVRLAGKKVGTLTKSTSEQMRDLVQFVVEKGRVPVCRAVLKGSALRAELTLNVAKSHEVTQRWMDRVTKAPNARESHPAVPGVAEGPERDTRGPARI